VVLRELIQNAADASTKSRKLNSDKSYQIEIEIIPTEDRSVLCADIAVRDWAGGMTFEAFKKYLACLGEHDESKDDIDMIGEWGIGFYAIVVIAKSAIIVTKTTNSDPVVCRYIVAEDRYIPVDERTKELLIAREFNQPLDRTSGTTVMVEVDFNEHPQLKDWLNPERLAIELRSYCLLIPYALFVVCNRTRVPTTPNLPKPPWVCAGVERQDALRQLWQRILISTQNPDDYPKLTYCFLEKDTEFETAGVIYFIDRFQGGASFYFKHMYVEGPRDLEPRWAAPFTILLNAKSSPSSPYHLKVPPARTHVVRNDQYFHFSDRIEGHIVKMIETEMANYKNALQAALTSAANPERRSEKIVEVNAESQIVTAMSYVPAFLENICLDLGDTMADALAQDHANNTLKDAAIALLHRIAPQVSRETIVPVLREHARLAQKYHLEQREAQKGNMKAPTWNPTSSNRFLRHVGEHLPVSVVVKEYPAGRQPHFTPLRIPISCVRLLDPGLAENGNEIVRLPVLQKGDPAEYLLNAESDRLVIVATPIEQLFFMCLAQGTSHYRLDLVSSKKSLFQPATHPEEWADVIRTLKQIVSEGREHLPGAPFAEVDVASFERKEVPLVTREVNGKVHLTVNAWNRGMKALNETMRKALQQGLVREQKALGMTLHELYHVAIHDESATLSQGTLHLLDVKEQALIEVCELLNELFDTRRTRA
jgi:hypothetical protein